MVNSQQLRSRLPALVGPLTVCPVFCRCTSTVTSDKRNLYSRWPTLSSKRCVSSTSVDRRFSNASPSKSATSSTSAVQIPYWDSHLPSHNKGDQQSDLPQVLDQHPFLTPSGYHPTGDKNLSKKANPKLHANSSRLKPAAGLQCTLCCREFGYWHSLRRHQKTCNETANSEQGAASEISQKEIMLSNAEDVLEKDPSKARDEGAIGTSDLASSINTNSSPELIRDCAPAAAEIQCPTETNSEISERFDKMAVMIDGRCRFQCDSCSFLAAGLASIRQHYTQHTGEQPFACEQCGCRYRLLNSLRKHIMRMHERVRQYNCDQCGRQFTQKCDLQSHRREHASERLFGCDQCGAQFGYRASLKAHLRTHASVPAFQCSECAKTFTHVSSFQLHMKRHRGELNYRCDTCNKAFLDKLQLRRHLAVHSEERPFTCDVCGATFKLTKYLQSHKRTHSKKKAPTQDCDELVDEDDSSLD